MSELTPEEERERIKGAPWGTFALMLLVGAMLFGGWAFMQAMLEDLARESETLARQHGGPRKGGGGAAALRAPSRRTPCPG